jgi:hypothetical protein
MGHEARRERRVAMSLPPMGSSLVVIASVASVVVAVASIASVPHFVARLPRDFLVRPDVSRSFASTIVRGLVGAVLVVTGVALLVLPGPGIVTLIAGLILLPIPGRHRAVCWLATRPAVRHALDRMRRRRGAPALEIPAGAPHG